MTAQSKLINGLAPGEPLVYVPLYGPQVSLLFAPLAQLRFGWALFVWDLVNACLYALSCWIVWTRCPALRSSGRTVALIAVSLPGFFSLIAWGQTSGVALILFVLAWAAWRDGRLVLAGAALGSLVYKPQLLVPVLALLVVCSCGRVLLSAILSAALQLAMAWELVGPRIMGNYVNQLLSASRMLPLIEPRPWAAHSSRAFFGMLLPWNPVATSLYVVFAIAVIVSAAIVWRRVKEFDLRFAILMLTTLLTAPHLGIYDLVLLAPVLLLLANHAASIGRGAAALSWAMFAAYTAPLLGWTAQWTHVQISVVILAVLFWICSRATAMVQAPPDLFTR